MLYFIAELFLKIHLDDVFRTLHVIFKLIPHTECIYFYFVLKDGRYVKEKNILLKLVR